MSSLHAANGIDSVFLASGIDGPECRELWLIHIRQFLAKFLQGIDKLLAVRSLFYALAQSIDDRGGGAFRSKNTHPEIIFEIVAQLLECRNVRKGLDALGARYRKRLYLSRADMRQCDRSRRHEEVDVSAKDGGNCGPAAIGRQMPH